jgi:hypothetical protein
MNSSVLRQPSAVLPVAMSLAALALVLQHVARFGLVQGEDEGTAAHLYQILMVVQFPIVVFYAARWLPQTPRQAVLVLALQALAAGAALATLYVFERLA